MITSPKFPDNHLGLRRGTVLKIIDYDKACNLHLKIGQLVPIGYDGKKVVSGHLKWAIDDLIHEIEILHIWKIYKILDLSDPDSRYHFTVEFESD